MSQVPLIAKKHSTRGVFQVQTEVMYRYLITNIIACGIPNVNYIRLFSYKNFKFG